MIKLLESVQRGVALNKTGHESAYENLAIAIVASACDDYRSLRRHLARSDRYDRPVIEGRLKEIELFLHSDYGDILCFGHADYVWEILQKEYGGRRC